MSSLAGSALDLSLGLHHRSALTDSAVTTFGNTSGAQALNASEIASEDAKAREAADKFEALLIHNMLKGMRKTTMTENKSNDRAIYDDMLDEKLADTMMQAGGIGLADQIVAQIRQQRGTSTENAQGMTDIQRLRELAEDMDSPVNTVAAGALSMRSQRALGASEYGVNTSTHSAANSDIESTSVDHLRLATSLWSGEKTERLSQTQHDFVQPLVAYARRNAQKLGTSPAAVLAIAALETGWGKAKIKDEQGNDSHNLFGIKATGSDKQYATILTTEYVEGSPQKRQENFKTYTSDADAVDGFADFILSNPRYSNALHNASDPERFLHELQDAGYATDPRYAEKAISIMRQIARNLQPL